jgi:hypothetical protein
MADDQAAAVMARLRSEVAGVAKSLILEIDAELRESTPVDTGHARANWVPSVGAPHTGEDAGAAHDAGVAAVLAYNLGDGDLYESNNVPYIGFLLGGSSAQAPAGWDAAAFDRAVAAVQARHDAVDIDVSREGGTTSIKISARLGEGE